MSNENSSKTKQHLTELVQVLNAFISKYDNLVKISSLVLVFAWAVAIIAQFSVLSFYNISFSFYSVDLIEIVPILLIFTIIELSLFTQLFPIKVGTKLNWFNIPYFIITAMKSILYAIINTITVNIFFGGLSWFSTLLFILLHFVFVVILDQYVIYKYNVFISPDEQKSNRKSKKILSFIAIMFLLLVTVSNMLLLINKKSKLNDYEILSGDFGEKVYIATYKDYFIAQDFMVDKNKITIYTGKLYFIDPSECDVTIRAFYTRNIDNTILKTDN